jgi:hypothetical protein
MTMACRRSSGCPAPNINTAPALPATSTGAHHENTKRPTSAPGDVERTPQASRRQIRAAAIRLCPAEPRATPRIGCDPAQAGSREIGPSPIGCRQFSNEEEKAVEDVNIENMRAIGRRIVIATDNEPVPDILEALVDVLIFHMSMVCPACREHIARALESVTGSNGSHGEHGEYDTQ